MGGMQGEACSKGNGPGAEGLATGERLRSAGL